MHTGWLCANAHAKVNLTLDVGEPRPDGYHSLRTVYLQVAPCDHVSVCVTSVPGVRLKVQGNAPAGPDNLAFQAASLWLERTGFSAGVEIVLEKDLPMGAGLAGGSSDAAAVLILLSQALPDGALSPEMLAAELGSDVAFFVQGGCALGEGRGEILVPLPRPIAFPMVVASPGVGVSTAWAYAELDRCRNEGRVLPGRSTALLAEAVMTGRDWRPFINNDFESVILPAIPGIAAVKRTLLDCGAVAAMLCGSGDSVFGVFDTEEEADAAVHRLADAGCWCRRA